MLVLEFDASVPSAAVEANQTLALRSQGLDDPAQRFLIGRRPSSRTVEAAISWVRVRPERRWSLQRVQSRHVHSLAAPPDEARIARLRTWLRPGIEHSGDYGCA